MTLVSAQASATCPDLSGDFVIDRYFDHPQVGSYSFPISEDVAFRFEGLGTPVKIEQIGCLSVVIQSDKGQTVTIHPSLTSLYNWDTNGFSKSSRDDHWRLRRWRWFGENKTRLDYSFERSTYLAQLTFNGDLRFEQRYDRGDFSFEHTAWTGGVYLKRIGLFKGRIRPYQVQHYSEARELFETLTFSPQMKLKKFQALKGADSSKFTGLCDPAHLRWTHQQDTTWLQLDSAGHSVWLLQRDRLGNANAKEHLLVGPKIHFEEGQIKTSYRADERFGPRQVYKAELRFDSKSVVESIRVTSESPVWDSFSVECGI